MNTIPGRRLAVERHGQRATILEHLEAFGIAILSDQDVHKQTIGDLKQNFH